MKKTTIYLPDDLKKKIEAAAKAGKQSEADVIREALTSAVDYKPVYPAPRVPLPGFTLGDPTIAERAGDLLEGFGE